MNMNREAVNTALGYAGNQPLTDTDKQFNNTVYRLCKELYLPTLFNSLTELDWKCARKYTRLYENKTVMYRMANTFYYDIPADCIKPIHVDDNKKDFRIDADVLITSQAAEQLYYVYHNRKLGYTAINAPLGAERDNQNYPVVISAGLTAVDTASYGVVNAPLGEVPEPEDEDFPAWEYTPFDADFWDFFSYKLAARIIPRLRADDGTAARAQRMTDLAEQAGAKAVLREKAAEANVNIRAPTWSERLGTRATYGGGYARRSI
jgi:hypothetical protein